MNEELMKKMQELDPEVRDKLIYYFNSYHKANRQILDKIENVMRRIEYGHSDDYVYEEMDNLFKAMIEPLQITSSLSELLYGNGAVHDVYYDYSSAKKSYINHLQGRLEKVLQERKEKEQENTAGTHKQ